MSPTSDKKFIALCLCIAFAGAGCHPAASQVAADIPMFSTEQGRYVVPEKSPLRTHLTVQAMTGALTARTIMLPAVVEADPARVVNVLAPLTGKIVALKVALGDQVKAGQVLAVIASGDMATAYADDDKAADALRLAKRAAQRANGVRNAGAVADKDLEAVESVLHQAQAEQTRTASRLRVLGGRSGDTHRELVLTAPAAGVVIALNIGQGANVNDPTASLMTLANLDSVFVTANVAEADVAEVAVGSMADITLTAYRDRTISAPVSSASAILDPDTRRQKVRIRLRNADGALKPNMFAAVRLAMPGKPTITVPQSALLMNNDTVSVLVEVKPWTFERRQVQIGDEEADSVHVLSGLKAGDRVVIKGGVLLND